MGWIQIFRSPEEAEKRVGLNKMVRLSIGQEKICLAHTSSGWYAIEDSCPHLGESLSKGKINYLDEVTCPWHSYRYSLKNGGECEGRGRYAKVFETRLNSEGLQILI